MAAEKKNGMTAHYKLMFNLNCFIFTGSQTFYLLDNVIISYVIPILEVAGRQCRPHLQRGDIKRSNLRGDGRAATSKDRRTSNTAARWTRRFSEKSSVIQGISQSVTDYRD